MARGQPSTFSIVAADPATGEVGVAVQEYAEGAAVLAAGIERFPDDPVLLYDLACYESMAGRGEDALGHLRQAVELDGSLTDLARGDSDFASLKGDTEFQALVA